MKNLKITFLILSFSLFSAGALAQSMTVIGGNAKAEECFRNTEMVATLEFVGGLAAPCNYALENLTLSVRDRAATRANRGIILTHDDKFDEALRDFEAALSLLPGSPEVYVNRGNVFFHEEDFEQAISDYSMAVELNIEEMHVAHLDRAMAYSRLGNTTMAEEDFREALRYSPEWELAERLLERLLEKVAAEKASAGQ